MGEGNAGENKVASRQENENSKRSDAWVLKLAPWLACGVALVSVIAISTNWNGWVGARTVQWTQNAFVKSEPTLLSTSVGGYVTRISVGDYQAVKAGDLIAEIDNDTYLARSQAAEATLAKAQAILANLDNEEAQQFAVIEQAMASLHIAQAHLRQAQQEFERRQQLEPSGAVTRKSLDDAVVELAAAKAGREAAGAAVTLAQRQLKTLSGQRAERAADRDSAAADLKSARIELGRTRIVAPFDGTVGRRGAQVGSLVSSGANIIAIVPAINKHIVANFKETQLTNVQVGQPVSVSVDALPGHMLKARVEQIAPMTGMEASVVPTDNATGNFTKVVQRIPVRIELEPGQPALEQLRSGMSVEAGIDTHGQSVAAYGNPELDETKQALADVRP
ncbi:HlyD family secretion protein [Agrobacterium sp. NPDC090273]|uniref:HlyD family secretion protein n=1 Tax=Agrobacterium sp. NPDC090273 TaxID=3363919 RepID=UPI00383B0B4D